jgi:uncharacterized DUF497 family protein
MLTECFCVVHAEILQAREKRQLRVISIREAVKRGPERVKLKNLKC